MKTLFQTRIGRLRIVAFLEGISLLALLFIAVPVKYTSGDPSLVRIIGPIHGVLFLLFILNTLGAGIEQRWNFQTTTWKVLVACMIPFGTFYIDRRILRQLEK